ncbi:dihydroneopterin aldolase [Bernardetia sp. MNP-M8]|uniref:dihydroneopterin aldolase n=1 Tax=Bernardetia sp. MNP-M8 TaxID=3127470 RepID=UPI0030CE43AC
MGKIALEELEFFAKHGVLKEEQIIGNRYRIDVEVEADLEKASKSDNVKDTVDYGHLYRIVEREVNTPAKLLEHLAGNILNGILEEIPKVDNAKVVVHKYNAPIGGVCKWSKVTLERNRKKQSKV